MWEYEKIKLVLKTFCRSDIRQHYDYTHALQLRMPRTSRTVFPRRVYKSKIPSSLRDIRNWNDLFHFLHSGFRNERFRP